MRTVDALNTKLNVVVQKLKAWLKKGDQEVMYDAVEMYGELNVSERLRMNDFLPHTKDWNELCAQFFQKKKKKRKRNLRILDLLYYNQQMVLMIDYCVFYQENTPCCARWPLSGHIGWALVTLGAALGSQPLQLVEWQGSRELLWHGMAWHGMAWKAPAAARV
jgi:hypothetical protein